MQRGFTLLETIIYLALFSIVMTGLVASFYGYVENVDRNQTGALMQEEGAFIIGAFKGAMSGAKTVSVAGSTLTITKYDATTITIAASGGDISRDGARLNNTNVTISAVTFSATSPAGIRANFTLSAKTPQGGTISQTLQTTSYIRK